jgi:hypothetical protein
MMIIIREGDGVCFWTVLFKDRFDEYDTKIADITLRIVLKVHKREKFFGSDFEFFTIL